MIDCKTIQYFLTNPVGGGIFIENAIQNPKPRRGEILLLRKTETAPLIKSQWPNAYFRFYCSQKDPGNYVPSSTCKRL